MADVQAPASAPLQARFVGSAACKVCHGPLYDAWATSPHAKTLTESTLPASLTGCEACHGASGQHIGKVSIKPSTPKATNPAGVNTICGACHFIDNSSRAPKAWQTIAGDSFLHSRHAQQGYSCLTCHTGHPNGNQFALRKPEAQLCLDCHQSLLEDKPGHKADYTHTPVAGGDCQLCHTPHGSSGDTMLTADVSQVCRNCHDTKDQQLITAHQNYPLDKANCVACHDPHSHDLKGHLLLPAQHMPFKIGKCELCHKKTAAGETGALLKPVNQLCFTCHPASTLMPANTTAHPPVKVGLCLA